MNKKELTEAAEKMQPHLTRNAVKNGKLNIQWTDDDHFIYSKDVESENGWVKKIYSVNCETGIETEIETSTPERSASGRSGIRISPDGQKGIASLRQYLVYNNIYFEGHTYLTEYVVKNCISCAGKNKNKLKREPPKQILTFCPRQRYIMDLTELPIELKDNNNYTYLFNIIDHFQNLYCLIL